MNISDWFDQGYFVFVIVLMIFMLIQYWLASRQLKYMNMVAKSYYDQGYLFAVGNKKKWLKKVYVLVVTDKNGSIIKIKKLDGITVFSKYKDLPNFEGLHINTILEKKTSEVERLSDSIQHALLDACQQLNSCIENY